MSEPRRMSDTTASDVTGVLLRSMRQDHPSRSGKHKTLAALGLASSVATTVASGAAAQGAGIASSGLVGSGVASGSVLMLAKWLAIGMVAGGVTLGGLSAIQTVPGRPAGAPVVAQPRQVASQPRPSEARGQVSVSEPEVPTPARGKAESNVVALPMVSASNSARSEATVAASSQSPQPVALAEEVSALDRIRALLSAGAWAQALVELDNYDQAHPNGRLRSEATLLRAKALMQKGDRESAARMARELAASQPRSPLVPQLRELIDKLDGGGPSQ